MPNFIKRFGDLKRHLSHYQKHFHQLQFVFHELLIIIEQRMSLFGENLIGKM